MLQMPKKPIIFVPTLELVELEKKFDYLKNEKN